MHPHCSNYYKSDALTKIYDASMVPILDKEEWPVPRNVINETVEATQIQKICWKTKEKKKNIDEKITIKINCCGQEGHNKLTCTFFPKEKWNSCFYKTFMLNNLWTNPLSLLYL